MAGYRIRHVETECALGWKGTGQGKENIPGQIVQHIGKLLTLLPGQSGLFPLAAKRPVIGQHAPSTLEKRTGCPGCFIHLTKRAVSERRIIFLKSTQGA